jgi:hypothetical protein
VAMRQLWVIHSKIKKEESLGEESGHTDVLYEDQPSDGDNRPSHLLRIADCHAFQIMSG